MEGGGNEAGMGNLFVSICWAREVLKNISLIRAIRNTLNPSFDYFGVISFKQVSLSVLNAAPNMLFCMIKCM